MLRNAPIGYPSGGGAYGTTSFGTSLYNPSNNMPNGNGYYPNTIYYRTSVTDANIPSFGDFNLELKADDGVVVYFNGVEVYRSRMAGTIGSAVSHNDNASGCVGSGFLLI